MYKTNEVAKLTKLSRQTLYNWIKEGKISKPKKKSNNRLSWSDYHIKEINRVIQIKEKNMIGDNKNLDDFSIGNRRYLGSKQKVVDFIGDIVENNTTGIETVADIFSGTGVVAHYFQSKGKNVIVNDILYSNYISYLTWFGNEKVNEQRIKDLLIKFNNLKGIKGYVTKNFGDRYFTFNNAKKIDAIREEIEKTSNLNEREKAVLLTSLMYAIDKVSNTVGHFDAFRKTMDNTTDLELKFPTYNNNNKNNQVYNMDANELVKIIDADLVYIDPPYNSRGYENTYHVLENILEWKKPEVEGIARKAVNRSEKGSDYTKSRAPIAFDNLIENINAKYILVSFNNTGVKGNSRSNAKISHYEIISTLLKRGKVEIFETDFSPFTTGKTRFNNHKELLYLCTVNGQKNYINTPLNYSGSKYKLLPQLLPYFPNNIKRFIEPFAGGAVVSLNYALYNKDQKIEYFVNDIEERIIDLYKLFTKVEFDILEKEIDKIISKYELSNTYKYGYEKYGCDSSQGLADYNRIKFNKLRKDYNEGNYKDNDEASILFYLLIVFGFNNQIRFNKSGNFNLPVGKRDFNSNMRNKLFEFHSVLNSFDFKFCQKDFSEFDDIKPGDFLYIDPPYTLGNASYNENGGWSYEEDLRLFNYLDLVHEKGGQFALSNVILHKNKENKELIKWASNYNLHVMNYNYNNSNYQSRANKSSTVEVLITNF